MKIKKFESMVSALVKPGGEIVSQMTAHNAHLMHMAMGISGEVGEVVEACMGNLGENCKDNNVAEIMEEVGDLEFYLEGLCQILCIKNERTVYPYGADIGNVALLELAVRGARVADVVKKICMYQDDTKWGLLVEEIQFFRNRLDTIYSTLPFTHDDALEGNFKKLSKRYEKLTYNDSSARNRADKD